MALSDTEKRYRGTKRGHASKFLSAARNRALVQNLPFDLDLDFLVSIATSLPELVVDLGAIRRGEVEIAIGDIIGSCVIDATISIGIGQIFFPQKIFAELAVPMILYVILASTSVIFILLLREKLDRKVGIILIVFYLFSYLLLFIIRITPTFDITSLIR